MLVQEIYKYFSRMIGILCCHDLVNNLAAVLEQRQNMLVEEGLRVKPIPWRMSSQRSGKYLPLLCCRHRLDCKARAEAWLSFILKETRKRQRDWILGILIK
jgi:hypothetical protein